ncbi:hypothetical protein [Flavihumibacter petaseus]|nr:hypothetical protein [Flavihumibacter petaseus]
MKSGNQFELLEPDDIVKRIGYPFIITRDDQGRLSWDKMPRDLAISPYEIAIALKSVFDSEETYGVI